MRPTAKTSLSLQLALIVLIAIRVPAPAASWQTVATSPACTGIDETALVALDGKLYLIGGRGIRPVEAYDPTTAGWAKLASPPVEMHHFQALAVGGRIAVVGAMGGGYPMEQPLSHIWWFDPQTNGWAMGASIPAGRRRGGAGAVLQNQQLYLVGGITNGHWNGFVPWLDRLDLTTGVWTILPDAPHARDHFNAVLIDGKIIAASGRTTYAQINKVFELTVPEVDVYDLAAGTWTTLLATLPIPRAGAQNVGRDGKVFVIGGESALQTAAHREVHMLTLATGQWEALAQLNGGRHGTGAAILDNTIYIASGVGNRGGSPLLNTTEKISLWPAVTVQGATSIGATTATLNGNVTPDDGGATVVDRGFVYGTGSGITMESNRTAVAGTTGAYSRSVSGLAVNTQYFYRAFASNSLGLTLSAETNFWTAALTPVISSASISGNNLNLSGNGGVQSTIYYVIGSANVATPIASWTRLATNTFGAGGTFTSSVPFNLTNPEFFFSIQLP